MTAPRSFREAFTEDPADVKDRARLVAERDSARDWAVALEGQNARLEATLTEIHQRAHLAFMRTGIRALEQITETAWAALTGGEDA